MKKKNKTIEVNLKTLKELFDGRKSLVYYVHSSLTSREKAITQYLLKEEGIKWANYLQRKINLLIRSVNFLDSMLRCGKEYDYRKIKINIYEHQLDWVKSFFNLTSEDLKIKKEVKNG